MRHILISATVFVVGGTAYWVLRDGKPKDDPAKPAVELAGDEVNEGPSTQVSSQNTERPRLPTLPKTARTLGERGGEAGDEGSAERREARRQRMIERFDGNGDGVIGEDERLARRAEQIERRRQRMLEIFDTNGDGELDADERATQDLARAERLAERTDRMIGDADGNGDGRLSVSELEESSRGGQRLLRDFASLDTNSDGFLDRDEVSAATAARREGGGSWRGGSDEQDGRTRGRRDDTAGAD